MSRFLDHIGHYLVGAKKDQGKLMSQYFGELYVPPGEEYGKRISKQRWFKILELSEAIFKLRGGKTKEKWENYKRRVTFIRKHIEEKEQRVYETPMREVLIELYWNQGLDAAEISQRYGTSVSTVHRWTKRRKVATRSNRWLAHEGNRHLIPNPYSYSTSIEG
mgnify:CR=1 FL=1